MDIVKDDALDYVLTEIVGGRIVQTNVPHSLLVVTPRGWKETINLPSTQFHDLCHTDYKIGKFPPY